MSDDLEELLDFMQRESDWTWDVIQAHRFVCPDGLIRKAQRWDRWIAAVKAVTDVEALS